MDFAPSIYEHCAQLIGRRPWDVSRDPDLLFQGQAAAFRAYGQRPVVVGVDIYNLEAEAYGATVEEPEGNGIPAVTGHCCSSMEQVAALPPFDPLTAGRIPMVIEVGVRLQEAFPEADVRIPVSGPFSIASNVLGFDMLLCEACLRPEATSAALRHLVSAQLALCRAVVRAGLDIAFFESAAAPPLLSPELFESVELPALRAAIDAAGEIVKHPVPCVIGGNTTPILPAILSTGTGYVICPAPNETDQRAFLDVMADHPGVMVRVNTRPDIVASGDWKSIRAEVDRVLDVIGDRSQACVGTGALPYETSPETILRIKAYLDALG